VPTKREFFVQTIRAQLLGARMRQLREERNLPLKYVAAHLGVEFSTLARYERAEWPFRRDHVVALLDVYHLYDEAERQQLVTLAQEAWRINQWELDGRSSPAALTVVDHLWLQSRAEELHEYATSLFPPLLWSHDYAEAVIQSAAGTPPLAPSKVDTLVRQCLDRQQLLDKKPPTRLDVFLEEPVLHQPVGGRAVLRAQLEHLARAVERPHVSVRLMPPADWHPGLYGAFTVCVMHKPYPPVVLVEHLGGRLVIEAQAAQAYKRAFDRLGEIALDKHESADRISQAAQALA
jgi:transcriptional regulator with XRE-family HTH domain